VYHDSVTKRRSGDYWDGGRVQALRRHLGLTQQELSEKLGTRQQTISEWETGMYLPRGTSSRLLSMVAEQAGFRYDAGSPSAKNS
jgi:DNA-binding transcriptional regulator YiaG